VLLWSLGKVSVVRTAGVAVVASAGFITNQTNVDYELRVILSQGRHDLNEPQETIALSNQAVCFKVKSVGWSTPHFRHPSINTPLLLIIVFLTLGPFSTLSATHTFDHRSWPIGLPRSGHTPSPTD
jgi:hypothetical protein